MAAPERVFIDLTSDDDRYEIKVTKLGSSVLTAPTIHRQPLLVQEGQQLPRRAPRSWGASRSSPRNGQPLSNNNHNLKAERSSRTARNGLAEPPAKRQRTSLVDKHDLETQLVRYVKSRLFPRITEITEHLAGNYERDRTVKLEYTIWCRIRSRIEVQWYQRSGKLSRVDENSLYAEIRRLVLELKDHPERLSSPPPVRELPSIIPSIKADPIRSHGRASTQLGNATTTSVVKDEEEQDISVLGGDEADIRTVITKTTTRRVPKAGALPVPRPRPPKETSLVAPLQLRARAKAKQWQSGKAVEDSGHTKVSSKGSVWFTLPSRPYLPEHLRQNVLGQDHQLYLEDWELQRPYAIHVDFSKTEIDYLQYVARELLGSKTQVRRNNIDDLRHLLKKAKKMDRRHEVLQAHETGYHGFDTPPAALLSRSVEDLDNFMADLHNRRLRPGAPQVFSARREELDPQNEESTISRIPSLLFAREVLGNGAFGSARRYEEFTTAFKVCHEDTLEPQLEWTNCAGDIMTLVWVSETQFICGTTTHSDAHNQQYNKSGNLLLGSTQGSLRAYPDHRIPRPVVSSGENSLDSMVESQEPWLFTSVVDSDYDPVRKLAYTASFDNTVKVWQVREDTTMENIATWPHQGRVNFVLASKHPAGFVATAADVRTDAVAVYQVGTSCGRVVDHYSCTQVHDHDNMPSEKWAYCPAAIRWGSAPGTEHLLLVGYSARSFTGDDRDIPEDKLTTGELCLWNTLEKSQAKVNSIATQNVFEVAWHPSRNSFAVATSKLTSAERADSSVRTQIRIFELNADKQYWAIKTLDCPAIDINELILRPNSCLYSYVAAGCTDGNVYVWDTAGSDRPMCVLEHGEPVEEFVGEKEMEDVGVKFIAWGTTADRLYTGSSDGVVKVWNIRHGKSVHLRDLIEVPGPITTGAFSPDHTRLVIGDGSGRVYLLSLDAMEDDKPSANSNGLIRMQVQGRQKTIRRPRPFTPHPDIPAPGDSGSERARGYLERGEILVHTNPCIGAVQGPNYASTQLFRAEAHLDGDAGQPLLAEFERTQQANTRFPATCRSLWTQKPEQIGSQLDGSLGDLNQRMQSQHSAWLDEDTRAELEAEGVEIYSDYDFEYESGNGYTSEEEAMD